MSEDTGGRADPTRSDMARSERRKRNVERLVEVEARLLECRAHGEICRVLSKKWGISERTIQRYIKAVYDMWKLRREEDPTDDREIHRQALGKVYREAMKTGKWIAATMALRERSHLLGLHPDKPQRIELSGPNGGPMEFADARRAAAERLAKAVAQKREKKGNGA